MKIYLEKRESRSTLFSLALPLISLLISLLLGALILSLSKTNPWQVVKNLFLGAFGSWETFTEVLVTGTPLILTGLGVSLAFRLNFWNFGAEGQLIWGGLGAAFVGLYIAPAEGGTLVYLVLAILAAMAGGAFWAGIPALLKTRLKINEALTTLLLNYLAILLYQYLYTGPWSSPGMPGPSGSRQISQVLWLPSFAGSAHIGLFIALFLAVVLWFVSRYTSWGFEWNMIGKNPRTSFVLGLNNRKKILIALLISGAISGLAGGFEVLGMDHRLQQGLHAGYGYTAIIIAWLAALNPLSIVPAALLLAGFQTGGEQLQQILGLPAETGQMIQALILLPFLGGAVFTEYRLKIAGGKT